MDALFLNDNQLTFLPEGVFDGAHVAWLYLNGNRLTSLPKDLFRGHGLEMLDLNDNRLTSLPEGIFDDLHSMEDLRLDGNHLVRLTADDPLFSHMPSLSRLHLSGQTAPPDQPETPEQINQPETPEQSGHPETPNQPETPSGNDDLAGIAASVAALQTRMAAVEAASARVDALQTRVDELVGSVDRLAASVDALRESLGQRVDDLETEAADAPSSRLLIVPLNQAEGTRREERR